MVSERLDVRARSRAFRRLVDAHPRQFAAFLADERRLLGLPPKPTRVWVELDLGRLRRLWRDGWTAAEIADALGCSPATVFNRVKALGLPLRGRGRRPRRAA